MLTVRLVLFGLHYSFRMPPKRGRKANCLARYHDDVTTRSTTKCRRITHVETAPSKDEAQAVKAAPPDIVVFNGQMAAMQQQIQSISDIFIGMATTAAATCFLLGDKPTETPCCSCRICSYCCI